MFTFKATIQNGRLRLDEAVDLPEGTEVEVEVCCADPELEESLHPLHGNTPEAIARWLALHDSRESPAMTDEEWEANQKRRREDREWELANAAEREKRLQRYMDGDT